MVSDDSYCVLQGLRLLSDIGDLLRSESGLLYKDMSITSCEGITFKTSSLLLGSLSQWIKNALLEGVDMILLPDVPASELRPFLENFLIEEFRSKSDLKSFFSVGSLLGLDLPSPEDFFPCPSCDKTFSQSKLLSRHLRVLHAAVPEHECPLCGQRCRSKSELIIHARTHSSDKQSLQQHVCEICGLKLGSRVAVRRHIKIHQKPDVKEMSDLEDDDEEDDDEEAAITVECSSCDKSFTQKSHLSVHEREAHSTTLSSNMCPTCGKTFSVPSNLNKHLLLHEQRTLEPLKHVCEFCGRIYESLHYLRIHVKTHLKDKPLFPCGECLREFPSLSTLKIHQKTHKGGPQFTCVVCRRVCLSKSALETHSLIHSGSKPHACDLCDKRFRQKSQLNYHLRTVHTSEGARRRPQTHFCPLCDKGFFTSSSLNKHQKTHNGERSFKCEECGKAFVQKAHLKTHTLQHTGERAFVCGVCGKAFFTNSNLKEHAKTHNNRIENKTQSSQSTLKHSSFPCTTCKKTFSARKHLELHHSSCFTLQSADECQQQSLMNVVMAQPLLESEESKCPFLSDEDSPMGYSP